MSTHSKVGWRSRAIAVGSAALAVALLVPDIAWAHPFVRGGQAPVDSLAELTLAMAHGCGTEQAGGGDPTLEVAMEVPEGVRIVDASAPEGWRVDLIGEPVGVVEWRAVGARDPAPDLAFSAVFRGAPGDEVYLKVFQGCEGFAYRWVGTPEEPASDPAIRIVLTDPDPDAPPPPEPVEPDEPATEASETGDAGVPDPPEEPAGVGAERGDEEPLEEEITEPVADDDLEFDLLTLVVVAAGVAALSGAVWWMQSLSRRRR